MDNIRFEQSPNHHLCLKDRRTLEITGVKKIDSFDSFEFLIETYMGYLNISGNELALIRLDQNENEVTIKGNIDSVSYVNDKKKSNHKESMFNKLMK